MKTRKGSDSKPVGHILTAYFKGLAKQIIDRVPSDSIKQMPEQYMLVFGIAIQSVLTALFLYLVITGFLSTSSQKYLAPSESAPRSCAEVLNTISGTYIADRKGRWEGQNNFSYSLGVYSFSAAGLALTYNQYVFYLTMLYSDLLYHGEIAMNNSLPYNILIWTSYVIQLNPNNNGQRVTMEASPLVIFDRDYNYVSFVGQNGICNAKSSSSFDVNSGIFTAIFQYNEFMNLSTCYSIANPFMLGYLPTVSNGEFYLKYDINSLLTSVAVNIGVLEINSLQLVEGMTTEYEFGGIVYISNSYVDSRYPKMNPILCTLYDNLPVCAFQFGYVYAWPIFQHKGNNITFPDPCNCHNPSQSRGSYAQCNLFDFIHGFIFWNTSDPYPIFSLVAKFGARRVNDLAFNASFAGSYWGSFTADPYYRSSEYVMSSLLFCKDDRYGFCRLMVFSSFDGNQNNFAISQYQFQLPQGFCNNTIAIPWNDFKHLVYTPFANLAQEYVNCNTSTYNAFVNSLGIAMGNVNTITPILVALMVGFIFFLAGMMNINIRQTYGQSEKDEIIDKLALGLLLARDGNLREDMGWNEDDETKELLLRLSRAAKGSEDVKAYFSQAYSTSLNWNNIWKRSLTNNNNNNNEGNVSNNRQLSTGSEWSLNSMASEEGQIQLNPLGSLTDRSLSAASTGEESSSLSRSIGNTFIIMNKFDTVSDQSMKPNDSASTFLTKGDVVVFLMHLVEEIEENWINRRNGRKCWEILMKTDYFHYFPSDLFTNIFRQLDRSGRGYSIASFDQQDRLILMKLHQILLLHIEITIGVSSQQSSQSKEAKCWSYEISDLKVIVTLYQLSQFLPLIHNQAK